MMHHRSLHRAFEARAATAPQATAVSYEGTGLTYGQLNARANEVARALRRLRIGRGALVGLCTERGLDMITGLIGILKAGAAYVPLDPAYPAERLSFLLSDSALAVVVTTSSLRSP